MKTNREIRFMRSDVVKDDSRVIKKITLSIEFNAKAYHLLSFAQITERVKGEINILKEKAIRKLRKSYK